MRSARLVQWAYSAFPSSERMGACFTSKDFPPSTTTEKSAGDEQEVSIEWLNRVQDRSAFDTTKAALQLAAIVNSSHGAIVSKDLQGTILSWNKGAERLFGYAAEEAIGKFIGIVIPPDRLSEEPQILQRIRAGEMVDHFDTVRMRKDGSLIDISLTISPVRDQNGKVVGASKIARDVSERKAMEARLHERELHLSTLLNAVPAAIYTTDGDGNVTYFNEPAAELAELLPELGRPWKDWKLFTVEGSPLAPDATPMALALREGRVIRNLEVLSEKADGQRVPLLPYSTPVVDVDGKILGAINMLIDISERKQAEYQQRILFNELNHRVKNNMQTLQAVLAMSATRSANPEVQAVLHEASGRVSAMAAAQKVLYTTPDAISFRAQDFLSAVIEAARVSFSRPAQVIQQSDDLSISNDVAMPLALILNELLTNASKYAAPVGDDAQIIVRLYRANEGVVLSVQDTGPGFDIKMVATSGLHLVQGLIRQIRGRFEVSNSPTICSVHLANHIAGSAERVSPI
jgi:PAS domain S-box-containing protein